MQKYEYDGKIYCEKDLSEEIDNYGGDLYWLYFALQADEKADETTFYYAKSEGRRYNYESIEALIENEFSDLAVQEL